MPPPDAQTPAPPLAGPAPAVERLRPVAITQVEAAPEIRLVAYQAGAELRYRDQEQATFDVLVEPPGPLRVFRFDTETQLKERMRQEALERPTKERIEFPDVPVLSTEAYAPGRQWEPLSRPVEPNYVCYGKLLFEEKNSERFGWDLGFIQPVVSTGAFYWDMFFLPYHWATAPHRQECSAGYRLPGDPVPYLLYPPELSVTGLWAQSTVTMAGFRFFAGPRSTPPNLRVSFNPAEEGGGVTPPTPPGLPPGGLPPGLPPGIPPGGGGGP